MYDSTKSANENGPDHTAQKRKLICDFAIQIGIKLIFRNVAQIINFDLSGSAKHQLNEMKELLRIVYQLVTIKYTKIQQFIIIRRETATVNSAIEIHTNVFFVVVVVVLCL